MEIPADAKPLILRSRHICKQSEIGSRRAAELIKNSNALCLRTLVLVGETKERLRAVAGRGL
ncbi:MAG TPA: hypothetical protein VKH41_12870 [Myxococcota bacterium]|nr:hypothetical protein [Myxococcota bacterium]